jgi:hypothetical protein
VLVSPVNSNGILDKVIGADAEKIGLFGQKIGCD